MRTTLALALMATSFLLGACSLFGDPGVEIAPYQVLVEENPFEIRQYERLVLVTTAMPGGLEEGQGEAFDRLFKYISGANTASAKIAMTAPVLVEEGQAGKKIAMTAPVFIDEAGQENAMSFVLPASYTLENAPVPADKQVQLKELKNYQVAALRFTGFLSSTNIAEHRAKLEAWLATSAYRPAGAARAAGYNPPWTIPFLRRNEVLIPVRKR